MCGLLHLWVEPQNSQLGQQRFQDPSSTCDQEADQPRPPQAMSLGLQHYIRWPSCVEDRRGLQYTSSAEMFWLVLEPEKYATDCRSWDHHPTRNMDENMRHV